MTHYVAAALLIALVAAMFLRVAFGHAGPPAAAQAVVPATVVVDPPAAP